MPLVHGQLAKLASALGADISLFMLLARKKDMPNLSKNLVRNLQPPPPDARGGEDHVARLLRRRRERDDCGKRRPDVEE